MCNVEAYISNDGIFASVCEGVNLLLWKVGFDMHQYFTSGLNTWHESAFFMGLAVCDVSSWFKQMCETQETEKRSDVCA
jgi:hypothetical protein